MGKSFKRRLRSNATAMLAGAIALLLALSCLTGLSFTRSKASADSQVEPEITSTVTTSADDTTLNVKLTIYFYRIDGDYTGYECWVWANGGAGAWYPLDQTEDVQVQSGATVKFAKTAELSFTVPETTGKESDFAIGYLVVKDQDWNQKDWGSDRHIKHADLGTADSKGDYNVKLYTLTGEEAHYFDAADVDTTPRFVSAIFSNFKNIALTTSIPMPANTKISIREGSTTGQVLVEQTPAAGGRITTIPLINEIKVDLIKDYFVTAVDATTNIAVFKPLSIQKSQLYASDEFNDLYAYSGDDLGVTVNQNTTVFKVWSPFISQATLNIYENGSTGDAKTSIAMEKGEKAVWSASVSENLTGKYYTYSVVTAKGVTREIVDPYAKSTGANGERGMIIDLAKTNPDKWESQARPKNDKLVDAVIYEAHIRDLTIHSSSGVSEKNRGKFLGLTEENTKNAAGDSTALAYLKELGVTELHILPSFDFQSVDELGDLSYDADGAFNWGYDPQNYNVPEGSYSTNPSDGTVRVNEMKQMIMALHNAGIRVVMDVVYNHTYNADSNFAALGLDYYYRTNTDGSLSNGSGCGNETASERAMFRKFMVDSVAYWQREYKIDGFRFDLMGLHDITTMNEISKTLHEVDENVIIYGEPWTAGSSPLDASQQSTKVNANKLNNIAVFNDDVRDAIKGSVFDANVGAYIQGKSLNNDAVVRSYLGGTGTGGFANSPSQSVTYVSAHDNNTLWDKILVSTNATETKANREAMNRLAATLVLTGQGISFFQAGEEMMRSKVTDVNITKDENGNDKVESKYDNNATKASLEGKEFYVAGNSYKSPDSVNAIDWSLRTTNKSMVEYYKGLIAISKAYPEFRFNSAAEIKDNIEILIPANVGFGATVYSIKASDGKTILVASSNKAEDYTMNIPYGDWQVICDGEKAGTEVLREFTGKTITLKPYSAQILVGEKKVDPNAGKSDKKGLSNGAIIGMAIGIPLGVIGIGFGGYALWCKKKGKKVFDFSKPNADKPE